METKLVKNLPTSGMTQQGNGSYTDAYGNSYKENVYGVGTKDYGRNYTMTPNEKPANTDSGNPSGIYSTPTNYPVSSMTGEQNNRINEGTGATTTTPQPLSEAQAWYMKDSGLSEDDVRALSDTPSKRAAIGSAYSQYTVNKEDMASSIEAENASWQSTLNKINIAKQGSLEWAKAAASAANPYAETAGGVDYGADAIQTKYATLEKEAQAAHSAAMANLKAGNMKAAADNLKTVDDLINSISSSDATLAQNKASLENTKSDQSETLQNVNADNFRQNLTAINYTPEQIDDMATKGTIYSDPTFLAGVKSMADQFLADPTKTSQAIIDTMKTGSLAKQKATEAREKAAREYNLALVKASQSQQRIDLTDRGTAIEGISDAQIQDIYANASTGVSSDKIVVANANKIADYVSKGNLYDAKKLIMTTALTGMSAGDKTSVVQKQATIDELETLKKAYQEYGKTGDSNIINANMTKFANYLGINVDPKFTKNDIMKLMIQQVYRKSLTGAQFSEKESTEYEKIFPQGKDSTSLKLDKIDAVIENTRQSVRAVYDAELGAGNYDKLNKIMPPTGDQMTGSGTAPTPPKGSTLVINKKTGAYGFKDASGNITPAK